LILGENGELYELKDYSSYDNLELPTRVVKKFLAHTDEITTMIFNP
jgi:hypothetical protein